MLTKRHIKTLRRSIRTWAMSLSTHDIEQAIEDTQYSIANHKWGPLHNLVMDVFFVRLSVLKTARRIRWLLNIIPSLNTKHHQKHRSSTFSQRNEAIAHEGLNNWGRGRFPPVPGRRSSAKALNRLKRKLGGRQC